MDSTRSTTSIFPQSAIVGLVALAIVVLSLAIVGQTGILPFTLAGDGGAQAVPAVRNLASVNAEGLDMYFESERGLSTVAPFIAAGLAAYHESEWTTAVQAPSFEVGLSMYRNSEWNTAVQAPSFEAGLAVYRDSELSGFSNPGVSSNAEGMAIYRASEHEAVSSEPALSGWDIYRASEQGR